MGVCGRPSSADRHEGKFPALELYLIYLFNYLLDTSCISTNSTKEHKLDRTLITAQQNNSTKLCVIICADVNVKYLKLEKVAIEMHCNLKAARGRASRSHRLFWPNLYCACAEADISELTVKILMSSLDSATPISLKRTLIWQLDNVLRSSAATSKNFFRCAASPFLFSLP